LSSIRIASPRLRRPRCGRGSDRMTGEFSTCRASNKFDEQVLASTAGQQKNRDGSRGQSRQAFFRIIAESGPTAHLPRRSVEERSLPGKGRRWLFSSVGCKRPQIPCPIILATARAIRNYLPLFCSTTMQWLGNVVGLPPLPP